MAAVMINTNDVLQLEALWRHLDHQPDRWYGPMSSSTPSKKPQAQAQSQGQPVPPSTSSSEGDRSPNLPARSQPGPKPLRRSRDGCQECRRLHRKCDEVKPACGFCTQNGRHCSYQKVLSWGGRPFNSSRFGGYIGKGAVKVPANVPEATGQSNFSFVYGTNQPGDPSSSSSVASSSRVPAEAQSDVDMTAGLLASSHMAPTPEVAVPFELSSIPGSPSWLPWLPGHYRDLLDYFAQTVMRIFVLDQQSVQDTCSSIIPMAVSREQSFHLLASMLCLAATHRQVVGLEHDETHIAQWKHSCIQHMQQHLDQQITDETTKIALAATALMLSMCDIVAGGEKPKTWRAHLLGAVAVLGEAELERPYLAENYKQPILNLCKTLHLQTTMSEHFPCYTCPRIASSILRQVDYDYIDEYHGFSTQLAVSLEDLVVMAMERRALQQTQQTTGIEPEEISSLWNLWKHRGRRLEKQITYMIEHPVTRLDPHLEAVGISDTHASEYRALDEAYHQVALLNMYSRLQDLPTSDAAVQEAVKKGIEALRRIVIRDYASPGSMVLQPLWALGCEAESDEDRAFIDASLDRWKELNGSRNAQNGQDFLRRLWHRRDEQRGQGQQLHWFDLMHELEWDLIMW